MNTATASEAPTLLTSEISASMTAADLEVGGVVQLHDHWYPIEKVNQKTYRVTVQQPQNLKISDLTPSRYLSAYRFQLSEKTQAENGGYSISKIAPRSVNALAIYKPPVRTMVPVKPFDSPRTIVENTYQRTLSVHQQEWIKRIVNGGYGIPTTIRVHERHQIIAEIYMPYSGNWHVGLCNRNGYVPDMYHRENYYWLRDTLQGPPLIDLSEVIVMDGTPEYQQLYTLGYTGLKLDHLKAAVKLRNWLVLDIRMSPFSRSSQWNRNNLQSALRGDRQSDHYIHLDALGNVNYRGGGAIQLKDPAFGLLLLLRKLTHQPVVLLCACAEVATCHRQTVSELVTAKTGLQPIHLTPADVKRLAEPDPVPENTTIQRGLPGFGEDRIIQ